MAGATIVAAGQPHRSLPHCCDCAVYARNDDQWHRQQQQVASSTAHRHQQREDSIRHEEMQSELVSRHFTTHALNTQWTAPAAQVHQPPSLPQSHHSRREASGQQITNLSVPSVVNGRC